MVLTNSSQKTMRKEAAAAYLGISLSTFDRLCKVGRIKLEKVPRFATFSKEDLDKVKSELNQKNQ